MYLVWGIHFIKVGTQVILKEAHNATLLVTSYDYIKKKQ